MRQNISFVVLLLILFPCITQTFARTIDVRLRISAQGSKEKTITIANLTKIKQFILKQGNRQTYCNMYNNNPAYHTKTFHFYLNPDSGQQNINCDPNKSDFNNLTIRRSDGGKNQYRKVDCLDKNWVYIVSSWPTDDLTVSRIRGLVAEAMKEILTEIQDVRQQRKIAAPGVTEGSKASSTQREPSPLIGTWTFVSSSRGARSEVEPRMRTIHFAHDGTFKCWHTLISGDVLLSGSYTTEPGGSSVQVRLSKQRTYPTVLRFIDLWFGDRELINSQGKKELFKNLLVFTDHLGEQVIYQRQSRGPGRGPTGGLKNSTNVEL